MSDLGSGGIWGAIFNVNFDKRVAQKLRRIIMLHFGLVTFRLHFGKTWKVFFFMIAVERVHVSQNHFVELLIHQMIPNTQEKPNHLRTYYFEKPLKSWKLNKLKIVGNVCQQIPKIRFTQL